MTQLPRAKRLGQLNIMEKIYTAALYGREGCQDDLTHLPLLSCAALCLTLLAYIYSNSHLKDGTKFRCMYTMTIKTFNFNFNLESLEVGLHHAVKIEQSK